MALGTFTDANTGAPDDTEVAFRSWYADRASRLGMNPNPDAYSSQYDFRHAFLEGYEPDDAGTWDHRATPDFARVASVGKANSRAWTRPHFGIPGSTPGADFLQPAPEDDTTAPPVEPAPPHISEATRADALKRIDALQSRLDTYVKAADYYSRGFVTPDEATSYRIISNTTDDYARRMAKHGAAFERGAMLGDAQIRNFYGSGFLPAVSRALTQGLAEAGLGAARLLGRGGAAMMPGIPSVPSPESIDKRVAGLRDKFETEFLGLPSDPIERAGYQQAYPWLGTLLGDISAWTASIAAPGIGQEAMFGRMAGALPEAMRVQAGLGGMALPPAIARMAAAGRGVPHLATVNALGALGGGIIGAGMAPDDARGRGALEGAALGLGGTAMLSTFLAGRPISTSARLLKISEMATTMGDEGLGGALRVTPRITFGRMATSAIEGAGYSTLKAIGQGTPIDQAIGQGVDEGLSFAGYDVGLAAIGRAAQWLPIYARISETWAKTAESLKVPTRMAVASGDAANTLMQAVPGALAGGILGPIGAVVGGAITAAKAAKLQEELAATAGRLRTTGLPEGIVNHILTGNWGALSAADAELVTKSLTKDIVERATDGIDPAMRSVIREAMGSDATHLDSDELKSLSIQRGQVTQAIAMMKAQGILEVDPAMVQASRKLAELAERRSQLLMEQANTHQAGAMGAVAEKVQAAQIREIVESAGENPGFAVRTEVVGKRGKTTVVKSAIHRYDPNAGSALERMYQSIRVAQGEGAGTVKGVTETPRAVRFATNSTLLRDLADAATERMGIDARISPEGARALDAIVAPGPRRLTAPTIEGINVGRPGFAPGGRYLRGETQRLLPERTVAPAGAKGVKAPLGDTGTFKDFDFSESGRIGGPLLRATAGGAVGGATGAAVDREHPLQGAAIGAAAGAIGVGGMENLLTTAAQMRRDLDEIGTNIEAGIARGRDEVDRAFNRHIVGELTAGMSDYGTPFGKAPATYKGFQQGTAKRPGFHIYNLNVDIPGHNAGSTVTEKTLREAGITPPPPPVTTGPRTGELGAARTSLLTPLAAGAVGAVLAPAIARRLHMIDEEDSALTASAVGFLTMAGLGYKMLARDGIRLSEDAARVARFVQPTVKDAIPATETARFVGVTGDKFKTTIAGEQVGGRRLYWLMPQDQQVAHTISNMRAWPQRTVGAKGEGLTIEARRTAFERDLKRFAPFSITDAQWAPLTDAFTTSTKALGYTDIESARLYRGWLGWMTTPLENRARVDIGKMSLDRLGRDATNPFASALGMDELRTRAVMADTLTGPPMPLPRNYMRATNTLNTQGTPDATAIRALVDDIESHIPSTVEGTARGIVPSVPWLAPNVRFYRYADRLIASGDKAVGEQVHRVTNGIFQATELARQADDVDRAALAGIMRGISTPDEMNLLRTAVESRDIREGLKGTNSRVYEAALGVRKFLKDKADAIGLPEFDRIDDYLPWVYNYRTKRELKELAEKGVTPNDINYPADAPVPRHVFFNHLESRTGDAPLGTLMSPYESLLMYSHGANRKIYMDQLLANFTPDTFARIRTSQPWIAHDLGRWLLDVVGLPGPGTMRVQKHVENIGLALEKYPMFQRPGLAQEINDKYFLSPGGANNLSKLATGWAYNSKIAFNFMSAAVNMSQQIVNGATEYGVINVLTSSMLGASVALGERAPKLAPVLDAITPMGAQYRKLLVDRGVLSETSQRQFDAIALYEANFGTNRAHLALTSIPVGMAAGAAGTAALNLDRSNDEQLSIAGGAMLGGGVATIGAAKSAIMRRALMRVRDVGTFGFNLVETWNRASVGIGGIREAAATERALASPAYAARRRAGEVVEGIFTGALGGGAAANVLAGPQAIPTGAALGALAAAGASPFGESRTARTARTLETLRAPGAPIFSNRIIRDQAKLALAPATDAEVNALYAQMQTDITQFRIAKEGRGYFLNTPHGQALGALQSFTINQAEFVGGRLQNFLQTANEAIHGQPTPVDFRVFRFASYMLAVGSIYGAILGGRTDSESDPDYWVSRLGFGVMPLLTYSDTAKKWELQAPSDLFKGPLIGDITRTMNSYLKLMQDDSANASFIDTSDALVRNLFPGSKNITTAAKKREGAAMIKAMTDGATENIGQARPERTP